VNCLAWLRPALRPLSVNEARISCRRPVHGDLGPPGNDLICYSCKILEPCWLQREVLLAIGRGLRDLSAPKGKGVSAQPLNNLRQLVWFSLPPRDVRQGGSSL